MAMKIARVEPGSEAEVLGLGPGDELLSVDENELNDSLDYDFYTDSKSFHLKARVADGIREWDVQRTERGPFGCDFQTYLGDQKHSCSNHCMFCFIDQLPPGMRESLYFKDDDERLSFLFGNYITMTNMQDHEIDRIIKMHISPINISVHTTNPQLRVRMLANKRGGEVLKYLPVWWRAASPSTVSWCCAAASTTATSCAVPSPTCWSLPPWCRASLRCPAV